MLDQALATPEVEARKKIMAKVEQNLRDSGIIIQPYWRSVYRTYRDGVHGVEQHQALEQHFEKAWLDRQSFLSEVPGFQTFHLLRGPEEDGARVYAALESAYLGSSRIEVFEESDG